MRSVDGSIGCFRGVWRASIKFARASAKGLAVRSAASLSRDLHRLEPPDARSSPWSEVRTESSIPRPAFVCNFVSPSSCLEGLNQLDQNNGGQFWGWFVGRIGAPLLRR